MRLPGPGPGDLFAALGKGADQVDALLGAVPRMIALLGQAEVLLVRATAAIEQVEVVTDRATGVVTRTSAVVDRAEAQVARLTPSWTVWSRRSPSCSRPWRCWPTRPTPTRSPPWSASSTTSPSSPPGSRTMCCP